MTDQIRIENPTGDARLRYEENRRRSLILFAQRYADTISSKVNLVGNLLGDAHEYSVGRWKESLLAEAIRQVIPARYAVGTGFIAFPKAAETTPSGTPDLHDHLVSKQCDILVYDNWNCAPLFRDGDFVVLRPEAVKAIVEVKGTLSAGSADAVIEFALDLLGKWQAARALYADWHQPQVCDTQGNWHHQPLQAPELYAMFWCLGVDKAGESRYNASRLRELVCGEYAKRFPTHTPSHAPLLKDLFVYRDTWTSLTNYSWQDAMCHGYMTFDGTWASDNTPSATLIGQDRTVSALLGDLQWGLECSRNQLLAFGATPSGGRSISSEHPHAGQAIWLANARFDPKTGVTSGLATQ